MQLSVKDAASLLRVPEDTIYHWIKEGVLPACQIDAQYRFNRAELLEWANSRQMGIAADVFLDEKGARGGLSSLSDALKAGGVLYRVPGNDKDSVLRSILELLPLPEGVDREFLFQVLLAREALGSTGIGEGIAIPHVRNPVILHNTRPAVTLCLLEQAIDFQAIDGQPVDTLFMLLTPNIRSHLHMLARLGIVLRDREFKAALKRRAPQEELLAALAAAEAALPKAGEGPAPDGQP